MIPLFDEGWEKNNAESKAWWKPQETLHHKWHDLGSLTWTLTYPMRSHIVTHEKSYKSFTDLRLKQRQVKIKRTENQLNKRLWGAFHPPGHKKQD